MLAAVLCPGAVYPDSPRLCCTSCDGMLWCMLDMPDAIEVGVVATEGRRDEGSEGRGEVEQDASRLWPIPSRSADELVDTLVCKGAPVERPVRKRSWVAVVFKPEGEAENLQMLVRSFLLARIFWLGMPPRLRPVLDVPQVPTERWGCSLVPLAVTVVAREVFLEAFGAFEELGLSAEDAKPLPMRKLDLTVDTSSGWAARASGSLSRSCIKATKYQTGVVKQSCCSSCCVWVAVKPLANEMTVKTSWDQGKCCCGTQYQPLQLRDACVLLCVYCNGDGVSFHKHFKERIYWFTRPTSTTTK